MNRLSFIFSGLLIAFFAGSCSYFLTSVEPNTVTHGFVQGVSPADALIFTERSYPIIKADWPGPGGDKFWLGVNLGASTRPETSVDDSPASAGWYFQFNRKQAFHHNGELITPQWRLQGIEEDASWRLSNDPCRVLLGETWRLPTIVELRTFREAPVSSGGMGEGNRTSAFNSELRLHAAGELKTFDGELRFRGERGRYWASDQFDPKRGEVLGFEDASSTFASNKAFGRPVRCIKD